MARQGDRGREEGQALLLAVGGAFVLIVAALALVAIAGAVTGKGRVQRAADLIAISAVRSMRDDLPRLLAPPSMPDGAPNPLHLEKAAYLWRARVAAVQAGRANEVSASRVRISFPDAGAFVPVRARATVSGALSGPGGRTVVEASAVAEAAPPAAFGSTEPATASGGGYGGPLAYRQGEGMRPDAAVAFDRMAAAAAARGHRSDRHLRLPLRRRTGGALRRPPRPALGRAPRPLSASLRDRARPRPRLAPTRWLAANAAPLRLRPAILMGGLALRI